MRPTVPPVLTAIFATTISQAESAPASEYLHPKTESRVLDDHAGPVAFAEKIPGFRTAAAGEVSPRWVPSPCPPVASHRQKIKTNAQSRREVPFHCRKKIIFISRRSVTLDADNTYGIITFPNRSRTMSCTTIGGANGSRDRLADPNSAVL